MAKWSRIWERLLRGLKRCEEPPRCARPLLGTKTDRGGWQVLKKGKVVPFLLDRLLLLLFSLHLTCPLWAPDARLPFPSRDAISAAQRWRNLCSLARLCSSLVCLQTSLLSVTQVPRVWRRLGLLFSTVALFYTPQQRAGSASCCCRITSETPARLRLRQAARCATRIRSAASILARRFLVRLSRQFSLPNADSRSLCPQAHKTSIYLLSSFLIRTQSWQSGRCDITDDTQQNTPPTQPPLHLNVALRLLRTFLKSVEFCSDLKIKAGFDRNNFCTLLPHALLVGNDIWDYVSKIKSVTLFQSHWQVLKGRLCSFTGIKYVWDWGRFHCSQLPPCYIFNLFFIIIIFRRIRFGGRSGPSANTGSLWQGAAATEFEDCDSLAFLSKSAVSRLSESIWLSIAPGYCFILWTLCYPRLWSGLRGGAVAPTHLVPKSCHTLDKQWFTISRDLHFLNVLLKEKNILYGIHSPILCI